jgi:hypothetical protein
MLHCRDDARFHPAVTLSFRPNGLIWVSSDQKVFIEEWFPSGHYHKAKIGGVLQRWLSFWKVLPSPSLELCQ